MLGFRLSAKAKADLKSIARYIQEHRNRDHRNRYLEKLYKVFHSLALKPHMGRPCDDIREGYCRHRMGRHLIYYRWSAEGIEIMRILHGSMGVDSHLTDE
jgi:toxin ParE1/3/4